MSSGIFVRTFRAEPAHATLVFLHGLGAHTGWFARMGELLAARGVASYAFDYPGHGQSSGPRGDVPRLRDVLDAADALLARARAEHPGTPAFLGGLSLGGLLALYAATRNRPAANGYIALSPPIADTYIPPLEKAAMFASLLYRPGALFACPLEKGIPITADAATTERMRTDPLALTHVTSRTYFQILTVMVPTLLHAGRITAPVLFLLGARDQVVSPGAIRSFARRVRSPHTRIVAYPHLGHDLKLEPGAHLVADDIVSWVQSVGG